HFDYGTASGGPYTLHTPEQGAGAGSSSVPASADVTGLSSDRDYYYVLVAHNVAGTTTGSPEVHFKTTASPVAPNAVTDAATGIGQTGATLNSTVNPKGDSTTVHFDYGTSSSSLTSSTSSVSAGAGASDISVPKAVSGLL